MKAPKHQLDRPVRPPTHLTRLHTAFIKSMALGEPPTLAARRIAKNPDHASQLITRFCQDPATINAVRAEVDSLLACVALPLSVALILETLKAGGKPALDAAKLVINLNRKRKRAADTGKPGTAGEVAAQQIGRDELIRLTRAKLAALDVPEQAKAG